MDEQYIHAGQDIGVGTILVYDSGVGGSTKYGFLKVTSHTSHKTPRVVEIPSISSEQQVWMDQISHIVQPETNPSTLDNRPKALALNQQRFYQYHLPSSSHKCVIYDPNKVYHNTHYSN